MDSIKFTFGLFDQAVLLLTGLTAIYLIWRFVQHIGKEEGTPSYDVYYIVSFAVLLVSGLLLIFYSYDILANPLVVVIAYLIPLGLSLGLVAEFYQKYEKTYLLVGIIGIILIAVTRLAGVGGPGLATFVLALFHTIGGLLIVFIPLFVTKDNRVPKGFIWVSVGGVLIDIGGISLAFLKAGAPILPADVIFTILAPLLLLMTLAYTWGFMKKMHA
ncbi:MAG TPA: hypothetical protein EYP36_11320 [Calditrichaeota bacterium]|nr:hypothetical protein [Calditrichota bacterium]